MADNAIERQDRKFSSRDSEKRVESWRPPETLPMPDPRDGYAHRWIRVSTRGEPDVPHYSSKLREGWEPCKRADYPELRLDLIDNDTRFKDNIVVGGLILCRTPQKFVDQRNSHYQGIAKNEMIGVDNNFMREEDPRMPLIRERKTSVTFGQRETQE